MPSAEVFERNQTLTEAADKEAKWERYGETAFKIGGAILVGWFIFSGEAGKLLGEIGNNFQKEVLTACIVEEVTVVADIFVINGQADAGFVVNALVNKTSSNGEVTITAKLSSTEGNVQKERSATMKKDQRSWMQLQFPEPTINAQQVTANVSCRTF